MSARERIVEFLCQGVSTTAIAEAVGVDPSYVSQIRAEPEIAEAIAKANSEAVAEDVRYDNELDEIEAKALERVKRLLPQANFSQSLNAVKILNNATRRNAKSTALPGQTTNVLISLNLPAAVVKDYVVDAKNQIVEVGGQTMLSATAKSLDQILAARAEKNPAIPAITDAEKAAAILENIPSKEFVKQLRKTTRRLPDSISPDLL